MDAILLGAFALLAVTDWVAVAVRARRLEYLAKPGALVALLLYAAAGARPSVWLMAALAFSLLGDVLLMLPADVFAAGLAAFLLAHVAYIAGFAAPVAGRLAWLAVIVAASLPIALRTIRAVNPGALRAAVIAYTLVISLMAASALASGIAVAAAGALLFLASDTMIAWNRLVRPLAWAQPAIMITYHLGQLGLVVGLRAG